jgi:hypothetical protein
MCRATFLGGGAMLMTPRCLRPTLRPLPLSQTAKLRSHSLRPLPQRPPHRMAAPEGQISSETMSKSASRTYHRPVIPPQKRRAAAALAIQGSVPAMHTNSLMLVLMETTTMTRTNHPLPPTRSFAQRGRRGEMLR